MFDPVEGLEAYPGFLHAASSNARHPVLFHRGTILMELFEIAEKILGFIESFRIFI